MLRVGRRGIVAFPNFGHWRVRLSMLFSGKAPRTALFPYQWYESPNIHFLTVEDFEGLSRLEGLEVERRFFLVGHRKVAAMPNLLAEVAVFLVRRPDQRARGSLKIEGESSPQSRKDAEDTPSGRGRTLLP
jgi:methionine biosynthesis protein MetW